MLVLFGILVGCGLWSTVLWKRNKMECPSPPPEQEQRIEQIFIAAYLRQAFMETILQNTPLRMYNDSSRPAFFYGLATEAEQKVLFSHRSLAVVIFTGGDAFDGRPAVLKLFAFLKTSWHTQAVAISKFIRETLSKHSVRHVYSPFYPLRVDDSVRAVPKGRAVCVYGLPHKIYHNDKVRSEVQPRFPDLEFIYMAHKSPRDPLLPSPFRHFPKEQMSREILPRCFVGIRLTSNDGLAGMVQELGVLGIKTIWNGGTPSAIAWKTMDDVVNAVEAEKSTIGVGRSFLFLLCLFFSRLWMSSFPKRQKSS